MEKGKETPDELSSVFDYPSIGELFASPDPRAVPDFIAGLAQKKRELESLIRRGTREEAERAARAVAAIDTTIGLIEEIAKKRMGRRLRACF